MDNAWQAGKLTISTLKDIYAGRPGAVLGGGSSLRDDLARIPLNSVTIAVNQHALALCYPSFLVYLDNPKHFPALLDALDTFRGIKISYREDSDVIFDVVSWDGGFSAGLATWLACWMGCDPVLLCGMDCYQDDHSTGSGLPRFSLGEQLRAWRGALTGCPNPECIRAVSGPLVDVFGMY